MLLLLFSITEIRSKPEGLSYRIEEGMFREVSYKDVDFPLVVEPYILWMRDFEDVFSFDEVLEGFDGWSKYGGGNMRVEKTEYGVNITALDYSYRYLILSSPKIGEVGGTYLLTVELATSVGIIGLNDGFRVIVNVSFGGEVNGGESFEINGTSVDWTRFSYLLEIPPAVDWVRILFQIRSPPRSYFSGGDWIALRDLRLISLSEEAIWRPLALRETSEGFKGNIGGLDTTLILSKGDDYIDYILILEGEGAQPKALELAVAMPIQLENWTWWDDFYHRREITEGRYSRIQNSLISGGYLPISTYPISAVTTDRTTVGWSIDLEHPVVYRFEATATDGLRCIYSLGVVGNFRYVLSGRIYFLDTKNGFRKVFERLYMEHSNWFTTERVMQKSEWEYSKFGVHAVQASFQYPETSKIASQVWKPYNVHIAQYILPWEFEPETNRSINEAPPDYWEIWEITEREAEKEDKGGRWLMARGVLDNAPTGQKGERIIAQILRGPGWRPDIWVPRIPINPDPSLEGTTAWNYTLAILERAINNLDGYGIKLDGVELDNFMRRMQILEHRIYNKNYVLTYDPNTFLPVTHLMSPSVEYLKLLRSWVDTYLEDGWLTANFVTEGISNFGVIYLDGIPFECSPNGFNWGPDLTYRRAIAGRKKVYMYIVDRVFATQGDFTEKDWELFNEYVETAVFYGFYPLFKPEVYLNEKFLETFGKRLSEAVGVVETLDNAGWKILPNVESNVPCERFGDMPLYITLRNFREEEVECMLEVSKEEIGISGDIEIRELFHGLDLEVERDVAKIEIRCQLPPGWTAVIEISGRSGETTTSTTSRSNTENRGKASGNTIILIVALVVLLTTLLILFSMKIITRK